MGNKDILDLVVNYRIISNLKIIAFAIFLPFAVAISDASQDFDFSDYKFIPTFDNFIIAEIVVLLMFLTKIIRNLVFRYKIYPKVGASSEKFFNANLKLSKLKVKYYKDENYVSAIEKLITRNENERNNL